jgi:bifunctional DNA primase/polymerase-like protein
MSSAVRGRVLSNSKGTLDLALNYVKCHPTRVLLPIKPDNKFPPLKPYSQASNDPAQLKRWHQVAPGCEWAMMHARSKCLVMGVDPRHGGSQTTLSSRGFRRSTGRYSTPPPLCMRTGCG